MPSCARTCDTCHDTGKSFYVGSGTALQLRPADHVASTDPRMATSDCSVCHETKDWVSTTLPAGHMPNPANLTCAQCHASAPSDYTPATLAANSVLHTGITGDCGQCHGNNADGAHMVQQLHAEGCDPHARAHPLSVRHGLQLLPLVKHVRGRHLRTDEHDAATHAFVPTTCDTCHEAGLAFYMGAASPALQGRPADHTASSSVQQQTGDCSGCHTTTNWTSATVMPPGHMPNPGNQACSVCHTGIGTTLASYATLASIAVLHTGITGSCCAMSWRPRRAADVLQQQRQPEGGVLTPSHIPYLSGSRLQRLPRRELRDRRLRPYRT